MTDGDFPLDRSIRRIRQQTMRTRAPRHLARHRLPWRLVLVAFGLTFAMLAAVVASAALAPKTPPALTAVGALPSEIADAPATTGPASSSTRAEASSATARAVPVEQPPGVAPVSPATWTTTAPAPPAPPSSTAPPRSIAPTTTEPQPAPVSTVAPTTTTVAPTTTLEPTTTTSPEPTTTTTDLASTTTVGSGGDGTPLR